MIVEIPFTSLLKLNGVGFGHEDGWITIYIPKEIETVQEIQAKTFITLCKYEVYFYSYLCLKMFDSK